MLVLMLSGQPSWPWRNISVDVIFLTCIPGAHKPWEVDAVFSPYKLWRGQKLTLASVTAEKHGATDHLLSSVVARLGKDGIRVLGALRVLSHDGKKQECESTLKLLPDGPAVRITQDLGSESAACRMDASALEEAVGIATARLAAEGADLIVLNKFGLREAEGHGFRSLIAEAIERGVPVLLGLSDTHRAAFEKFADGMATALPSNEDAVVSWCEAAVRTSPATEHIKDLGDPLLEISERPT